MSDMRYGIGAVFIAMLLVLPLVAIPAIGQEIPGGEREQDAVINGYVKDLNTGSPIEGASVSISGGFWVLEEPNIYLPPERWGGYNSTVTDENGYYEMQCWSGESWLYVYAEGYREYSAQVTIAENEVKQHDIQLEP